MDETIVLRAHDGIDPALHVWGWDVAGYLFLGGLVAGLLVFTGLAMRRAGRGKALPASIRRGTLAAPLLLSIGMLLLFIDLDMKAHVYRFYTAFVWTSPMSWGSWILLLLFPLLAALLVAYAPDSIQGRISGVGILSAVSREVRGLPGAISTLAIAGGAGLGLYTGILLGSSVARPLWSSAALGPLFLASGVSSAAALLALLEKDRDTRSWLARADMWALAAEGMLLGAFLVGHATSTRCHIDAIGLMMGGPYTGAFWGIVVVMGIALPMLLEWLEIKGRITVTALVPVLVLVGGMALRLVMLGAGQAAGVGGDAPTNTF